MKKKIKSGNKIIKAMGLVEVIIAIGIFSLMMIGIAMLFGNSWSNYRHTMDVGTSSLSAKQAIDRVVDVIRRARNSDNGSYPIKSVDDFDLVIYSDSDKDGITEKNHYYVDNGNFMIGISKPSGVPPTYSAGDDSTQVIVSNIVNTSSQPIFRYYDGDNNEIASPSTSLPSIRMIKVNLIISSGSAKDVNVESYASLRNLSEHDTIQ